MARYIISASCNPYHARYHHTAEVVLEWNGASPTKWIHQEFGSLKEANSALLDLLCETVAEAPEYHAMPANWGLAVAKLKNSEFNVHSFKDGTKSFQDDVVTYSTEILDPDPEVIAYRQGDEWVVNEGGYIRLLGWTVRTRKQVRECCEGKKVIFAK